MKLVSLQEYKPLDARWIVLGRILDRGCGNVSSILYKLEHWGWSYGLDFLSWAQKGGCCMWVVLITLNLYTALGLGIAIWTFNQEVCKVKYSLGIVACIVRFWYKHSSSSFAPTLSVSLHHGPWSWTMEDGMFPWSDLMVQLPWFDFFKNEFIKPLGPSLGVNRMWT